MLRELTIVIPMKDKPINPNMIARECHNATKCSFVSETPKSPLHLVYSSAARSKNCPYLRRTPSITCGEVLGYFKKLMTTPLILSWPFFVLKIPLSRAINPLEVRTTGQALDNECLSLALIHHPVRARTQIVVDGIVI